jgi:hypothetical protein
MEKTSNLSAVTFPVLIIADDGWVDLWTRPQQDFTAAGISTYKKRHVVIFDSRNHAWQVTRIVPGRNIHVLDRLLNRKVQAEIELEPVKGEALPAVLNALEHAIDADDDILTQEIEAGDLKIAIKKADSFSSLVLILKRAGAIY